MVTHHVLGEVGLDGELDAAERAGELPAAVVVDGLLVVLHGGAVAEGGGAEVAGDGLAGVGGAHVPVEAGAARELAVALRAAEAPALRRVRLGVARQRLLVLEGGAALQARVALLRVGVQVLVDGQVVLAAEGLQAVPAGVLVLRGRGTYYVHGKCWEGGPSKGAFTCIHRI